MAGPFTTPVAESVPFNNATNGFIADQSQAAIEEARDSAPGKARAHRLFTHNGTLGNNFWHGYSNLIDSNTTPMIIPWDCVLKEYTFAANGSSIDGKMLFYLNGTSSGDIIYTIIFNNVNSVLTDFPELSFSQGDLLRLRWDDDGQNPSDVASTFDFLLV